MESNSIELDILEELVENAPLTIEGVVNYVRRLEPNLSPRDQFLSARRVIEKMLGKGWILIEVGSGAAVLFPENWTEGALSDALVVATPKGESFYLGS